MRMARRGAVNSDRRKICAGSFLTPLPLLLRLQILLASALRLGT